MRRKGSEEESRGADDTDDVRDAAVGRGGGVGGGSTGDLSCSSMMDIELASSGSCMMVAIWWLPSTCRGCSRDKS